MALEFIIISFIQNITKYSGTLSSAWNNSVHVISDNWN